MKLLGQLVDENFSDGEHPAVVARLALTYNLGWSVDAEQAGEWDLIMAE